MGFCFFVQSNNIMNVFDTEQNVYPKKKPNSME